MFLHVFYSWLIAQVFHPVLFVVSLWLLGGWFPVNPEDVFFFILISMLVSLPSLFAGWLFIGPIIHSNYTIAAKFFMWLASTAVLVILTLWIIILVLDGGRHLESLLAGTPGILSVWVASIIRLKQFQKLDTTKNSFLKNKMSFETGIEDHSMSNY